MPFLCALPPAGKTAHERAVAGEALTVLAEWTWPAQPVRAPPQSPSWFARLGLLRG